MEVLELKPIKNKKICIYLIEKSRFNFQLNYIENLTELIQKNDINFITIDLDCEDFKMFKNTSFSKVLNTLNLDYYLLDMPEYAYGYIYEEIMKKEEQVRELFHEYQNMDDKDSFKGLNLKSWIEVLKKEVIQDKNILELKIRPQWIVKKILDLIKKQKNETISLIHFTHEKIISEIIEQLNGLHIEVIVYDFKCIYNIPYLIIKQGEIN
ncbi:MAG: hypothetical protein JSV23_07595 [Promethearchaeota archaeon]|nr:MAG: hypothetical protein JSV23_07595 [Candidatus Lokiarchaeota archaeon]